MWDGMTARRAAIALILVIPGVLAALVFGYYALQDWSHLQTAYRQYEAAAKSGSLRSVTLAFNAQSIHRINLFAEGVWPLLAAIWAGIGIHGLCVMQPKQGH
jgi:hypothetical protein